MSGVKQFELIGGPLDGQVITTRDDTQRYDVPMFDPAQDIGMPGELVQTRVGHYARRKQLRLRGRMFWAGTEDATA